jgi:hypothetical protein
MAHKIPLWIKILYTLFVAVVVPCYWIQYSPVNFLWFCDVALLITVAALWLESALLVSMQALAITVVQSLWIIDFILQLTTGIQAIHLADYMFDPKIPLFMRGLSLFHGWLPLLLLWMVWRLGYDRRALFYQTVLAWLMFVLSYVLTDGPTGPAGNVNQVYGPASDEIQTWMHPWLWLALLMTGVPLCFYVPTHLVFRKVFPSDLPKSKEQPVVQGGGTFPLES